MTSRESHAFDFIKEVPSHLSCESYFKAMYKSKCIKVVSLINTSLKSYQFNEAIEKKLLVDVISKLKEVSAVMMHDNEKKTFNISIE